MKVILTVEKNDNNLMEFNVGESGLTEKEFLKNIIAVATEWLKRLEEDGK